MDKFGSVVDRMNMKLRSKFLTFRGLRSNFVVLFLCGAHQLVLILRSSVLMVLDLNEVDVTLQYVEIFGSILSGEG